MTELVVSGEIDQHAAEVEKQNVEGRWRDHEPILAHQKKAPDNPAQE